MLENNNNINFSQIKKKLKERKLKENKKENKTILLIQI
jgi:hypothetical protein